LMETGKRKPVASRKNEASCRRLVVTISEERSVGSAMRNDRDESVTSISVTERAASGQPPSRYAADLERAMAVGCA